MPASNPTAPPEPSGTGTRQDASPSRPVSLPAEGGRDEGPLSPQAGQRARRAITATGTAVVVTSFVFSFGNITDLGKRMGLGWLAYPLAPAVDLTVLALVWGERYASLSGIDGRRLRPVRLLVLTAGLGTWALNTAAAWSQHDYGKVALDSIAPALLMVWTGIGPWFLRLFVEIRQREQAAASPAETVPSRQRSTQRSVPPRSPSSALSNTASRARRSAETGSRRAEMVAWVLAERAAGRDPAAPTSMPDSEPVTTDVVYFVRNPPSTATTRRPAGRLLQGGSYRFVARRWGGIAARRTMRAYSLPTI